MEATKTADVVTHGSLSEIFMLFPMFNLILVLKHFSSHLIKKTCQFCDEMSGMISFTLLRCFL